MQARVPRRQTGSDGLHKNTKAVGASHPNRSARSTFCTTHRNLLHCTPWERSKETESSDGRVRPHRCTAIPALPLIPANRRFTENEARDISCENQPCDRNPKISHLGVAYPFRQTRRSTNPLGRNPNNPATCASCIRSSDSTTIARTEAALSAQPAPRAVQNASRLR